jgi:hypothetical protein
MTLNYPLRWNPAEEATLSEDERDALLAALLAGGLLPDPEQVNPERCPELWALLHQEAE